MRAPYISVFREDGGMPVLRRLREIRERQFLTQAELAKRSGIAEMTISRLELGRHPARLTTARKLAEALGVHPAELVGEPSR